MMTERTWLCVQKMKLAIALTALWVGLQSRTEGQQKCRSAPFGNGMARRILSLHQLERWLWGWPVVREGVRP